MHDMGSKLMPYADELTLWVNVKCLENELRILVLIFGIFMIFFTSLASFFLSYMCPERKFQKILTKKKKNHITALVTQKICDRTEVYGLLGKSPTVTKTLVIFVILVSGFSVNF